MDAASPGDTVVVEAGKYPESVSIHTDGLTLRAQGNDARTSAVGSSECYLPGPDVGICVAPATRAPAAIDGCVMSPSPVSAWSASQGTACSVSAPGT